ncbi:ZIP family metal transporter [Methylophilus glucosoxydans]|uniref:ZIP family metal transporter n=1 Tax=Methylophilus glucosoxydans TaxID=752553 RepID=A0ABW3GIJ9_9PROT
MLFPSLMLACTVGGVVSVLIAGWLSNTLFANHARRMVAFAVGVLLGFAFTDLLPEALNQGINLTNAGWMLVAGMLLFFILEKLALWRHFHHADAAPVATHPVEKQSGGQVAIILLGDGIHNFVDGILLAASFLTDIKLGWVTAFAIVAHEIPQEISDFMVLIHAGLSKPRALLLNMLSGSAMIVGGLVGWLSFTHIAPLIPYALLLAAASFIYIALADLVPTLQTQYRPQDLLVQCLLIACGLGVAWLSPFIQQQIFHVWSST